ncbi:probable multidrug resistance-associated protein lethal(2)03659 [Euwallacea fornicatus]|uniref:probable multidrug resistance-associated protein lethal(2)03659 n=1 Tax=Euwallacea fornicatus TaxID=995702 RepID=UPI0033900F89
MDNNRKFPTQANPVQGANPLSELMFLYMLPIFKKGFKKKLTEDDLFSPLKSHNSCNLGDRLEEVWREQHRKHKKSALHRALLKIFGLHFFLIGIITLINELVILTVVPLSIGKLVRYFETGQTTISEPEAYMYCAGVVLGLAMDAFVSHPKMMSQQHLSMKMRVACSSLIYRKTMKLSQTALGKATVGQMTNLLSNDLSRFDQGFVLAHYSWVGPIEVAFGTWLLYREIGYAALFGMAFLISFVPLQAFLAKRTSVLRLRTALRTDERVRLMNEVISGIQVIKMYCWENHFSKLVALARKKEMQAIRSHAYIMGLIYSFEVFVSRSAIFISILGYVLLGNLVTAERVFAITAIYNVLRPVITILFSISISSVAEVNVSIMRVQQFLNYEEVESVDNFALNKEIILNGSHGSNGSLIKREGPPKVVLKNVCAKWSEEAIENTLENISLSITSNQLVAVVGPVGAGKSSLINVILRELPIKKGHVDLKGKISLATQEPWLFSGSIRQNILFGEPFLEDRYEKVVQACALKPDFALFPHGDKTPVGEKGKVLSGGQKARINLARCIYKEADVYLMDDPLSAVDVNVGKHLYEICIRGFLKDKIRILATHQLQYLQSADRIVIINDGRIQVEGNYAELLSSGVNFSKLLEYYNTEENEEKRRIRSCQNSESKDDSAKIDDEENDEPPIAKESQSSGKIASSVYWKYLKAGGNVCVIFCLIVTFVMCQGAANGAEYFVTYWVGLEQDYAQLVLNSSTNNETTINRTKILYIYSGLTLLTIIIAIIKSISFMVFFTVASRNLHDFIFSQIIRAKMKFFNLNPTGRILNRFSKDMGNIDEYIPSVLIDVIEIGLLLGGTIVLTSVVEPFLMVPATVLIVLFYAMRCIYIQTSRSVKRIEAITKSPVFSHMTASVQGLSTIRAFSAQKFLINEFDELQNHHSSSWFLFIASSRCFAFWLDIICISFIAASSFSLIALNKVIHGGDVGLVITQYIGLMGSLQWGMRQWSELENQMTSVERVLEYTKLENEPERKEPQQVSLDWPKEGRVTFKDVRLRYNETDPYVLKSLSFTVHPNEKLGIVGRTGAGKSSTISALFQLYDLEGSIVIDGLETTELPLEIVRSKISIIPQEPVLFSGPIRKNLDPFQEYSDELLWNALEQVELKSEIAEMPSGLNSNVSEGGSNFSVGQRQLICLARALIRNNKILVMDEATANVDPHTDSLIQNTIRNKFKDCTVFTIAHRLHTVMDSDKVLVMSAGTVKEFNHPHLLLQKEHGILHNLVENTGKGTAKTLRKMAEDNYLRTVGRLCND